MKQIIRILVLAILLPTIAWSESPVSELPKGLKKITSVEGITEYSLENGMHILLFPDPTKDTVTVNITYLVGSLHENYGETGMAHLLEHLVFRGTERHPSIRETMTQRGARFNGSTWFDRTNYFETFPASDENLEWALDLEADRMVNSFISKKDLDQEMTVVRNEFEAGENDPFGVLMERVLSTAYLWHNYGKSTIGARSDLENVSIDRLQAFYRSHYQPDNAVLLIAGKFDEARAMDLVARFMGALPRPQRTLPAMYTMEPTQDGERQVTLRRVGDVQVAAVAYHVPSGSHPDFAALDILSYILADTPSGRLHKELVEKKKASSVFGFNFQQRQPGIALFAAEVRQDASLEEARDALIQTVESTGSSTVTPEEVERARTALLKEIELAMNSSNRIGVEMSEWMAMGDWRLFFLHRDRLRQVTVEDVKRVASTYFKQSNRTLGLFIPTKAPDRAEIPAEPDIASMLKDYKGDAPVKAGEAFDPSPANIETRVVRTKSGNVQIALLPKKTRGETVVMRIIFRFGDESSLKGRTMAGELAGDMLLRGTTHHTRQQIQDEFDRLKARVVINGSPTDASVAIETEKANLPDVLRLVAEVLKEPAFPESEFELLRQENLAAIEQELSDPNALAGTEYQRILGPYPPEDVRYTPTLEEEVAELKAAKIEDVRKFYADFYGAANAQAAVVGDFDARQITGLITELFGSWKSPMGFQRVPSPYQEIAPADRILETPDKANAFYLSGMKFKLRDDNPDYPALVLGNYMLGGAANARLKIRIRDKEGLSYGVGSVLNAGSLDESANFTVYAIYAPENLAKLEEAMKDEITLALKDGFPEEEVATAKQGYAQSRRVGRAQDSELAARLLSYLFLDRTILWDADFEKKIEELTPARIAQAMQKYIDPSKFIIVKAGDFKKQ